MNDPQSTVRESEQASVENARGIPATVRNLWNKTLAGTPLTKAQREDLVKQAKTLFGVTKGIYNSKVDGFIKLGKRFGLEKGDIVVEGGGLPELQQKEDLSKMSMDELLELRKSAK